MGYYAPTDTSQYGSYIHTNEFLTNFLLGRKLANPVADFVAPPLLVKRQSDKYGIYNHTIDVIYNNEVKRGDKAKEIDYQVDQAVYLCKKRMLGKSVYWEDRTNTDGVWNLDYDAVRFLKRSQAIAREYRVAKIVNSTAFMTQNKDNTSTPYSSVSTGNPLDDFLYAMGQIADGSGGYVANRAVIPTKVALNIVKTTNWKDSFKWSSLGFGSGLFSIMDGLKNLGLEPMITTVKGTTSMSISGSDPGVETIWGSNVLIFYCEPTPSLETRTLMYSPYVFRDVIETIKQVEYHRDFHQIYEMIDETLIDPYCGFLLTNNT